MKTLRCALLALTALLPASALATSTGIGGLGPSGCNQCHSGGTTPMTSVMVPATVQPGEKITVTVSVTTPNGNIGGFNLKASAGTFSNPGAGVKLLGGQATHSTPKSQDASGNAVFTVDWTAPMSATTATFTAWGNSANGNGLDSGDRGASATASVQVCGGTFFRDEDGDGVGGSMTQQGCTAPTGYVAMGGDCDDSNPNVKPGATETCNMVDDDCDLSIDDGAGNTYYVDGDADGFGDSANAMTSCSQPTGYVTDGTDCDDANASVKPGATETCNSVDDDCDGMPDDGLMCMNTGGQDAGMTGGNDAGTGNADGGTNGDADDAGGCGCASAPASALALFGVIAITAAATRRRRRS